MSGKKARYRQNIQNVVVGQVRWVEIPPPLGFPARVIFHKSLSCSMLAIPWVPM